MADSTKMTAFRFSEDLLRRLEKYAKRLSEETGLPVTRADAVRLLLTKGLDGADEAGAPGGRSRGKGSR
jgi:hypothetical protein